MKRSEEREQVFKLLFRVEFNPIEEMAEQEQLFSEDLPESEDLFMNSDAKRLAEKDADKIRDKYEKIAAKLPQIDEMINEKTLGWDTERMAKVDLTIIRLAVYEIKFDEDIPTGVAINEAVELAKKFGQDGSASFVNGVLAKFA
ncbi:MULTISPECIES: transcription antitermination factor NusB [Butyrivibrio]|jgi:N utilization substance protein B|uniref:Transcription antitermination protein NusB n=1 Tax=Butyrivibrio fibrisolvens TaxID=831 RepID=A0A1H9W8C7_BUTFI|nr:MULTISPECIES: transcription antitermination factor NusB [Butyrivibrio]MBQ1458437.1 transcription antitermination factor NusB [Butyrivibrio sp.]SEQ42489.1 NusB antitermination factor [Butyrivibrio sp. TB]SES30216.1 NusB antitermination factor [Butyrivibrio fibrisolvens]